MKPTIQKRTIMPGQSTPNGPVTGGVASAVKTTLTGGLVFLLPLGLFLLVFSEVMDLFLRIAAPIASRFPEEDWLGIAANNVIAWGVLLLVCYCAGLIARFATISKYSEKIDSFLSGIVPGYNLISSKVTGLVGDDTYDKRLKPVLVRMGTVSRYGLESERNAESGSVTVYLPGCPDPMTGIVVRAEASDVTDLDISASSMIEGLRRGGTGLFG